MSVETRHLPVFDTVGQSISFAWNNVGMMVRLSWLWVIVVSIVSGVLIFVLFNTHSGAEEQLFTSTDALVGLVFVLVYFAAAYSIAVGWHRALLLGERPGAVNLRFGRREFGYFCYAIVIALICWLPAILVFFGFVFVAESFDQNGSMKSVVGYVAVFVGLYVALMMIFSRLFLVLPGTAVGDRRMSLTQSIRLTKGNTWRIFGGFMLVTLLQIVPNILTEIAEHISNGVIGSVISIVLLLASLLISIALIFVALSYMSYSYWFFAPSPGEGDLKV